MLSKAKVRILQTEAKEVRKQILKMILSAHASHIGSSYSIVELLVYIYKNVLRIDPKKPLDPKRDRFILSKGWGVSALYTVLQRNGFLSRKLLDEYCKDGSRLVGISTRNGLHGIEATTGSMGHGLPLSTGIAKALLMQKKSARVVTIISDGECDEGSTWESILIAGHFKLSNLTVVVDYNKWQSFGRTNEVLNLEPLERKWRAFNWDTQIIDGHNFNQISDAFKHAISVKTAPQVIIARTVKGKGLPSIEDKNEWHYQTPREAEIKNARKVGLL